MAKKKFLLSAILVLALGIAIVFLALLFVSRMTPRVSARDFEAHQQEALEAMNKALDKCQEQYMYGELKTHQQDAECAVPGIVDAFRNTGFPFMDLIQSFAAKRVEIAKELDHKQITQAEAQQQELKFLEQLQAEARNRQKAGQK